MRPIDADALISKVETARKKAKTLTGMDFVMVIKDQPTIASIPVEWLEAHKMEYNDDWGVIPVAIVKALIMWQNEQEAKDGKTD